MRRSVVVVVNPVLDDLSSLGHGDELLAGEEIVSKAVAETLHVAVLPRTAWLDVESPHLDLLKVLTYATRDEPRPIVTADEVGDATTVQLLLLSARLWMLLSWMSCLPFRRNGFGRDRINRFPILLVGEHRAVRRDGAGRSPHRMSLRFS